MRVIARHRTQPIVVLDDDENTVLDTEDLEVLGSGAPDEGPDWDYFPEDDAVDPRWEEIVNADSARLDVEERPTEVTASGGKRSYRAPKFVRNALVAANLEGPAAEGQALSLQELIELSELELPSAAQGWVDELTVRETVSVEELEHEAALFALAEPELDWDEIDAACEPDALEAAATFTEDRDQDGVPDLEGTKVAYLAQIEEDDVRSVQDLFAVVSAASGAASVYKFEDGGWIEAPEFAERLRGATPPPVRELDAAMTAAVIQQITATDAEQEDGETATEEPETEPEAVEASAFELPEARMLFGPDNQRVLSIVASRSAGSYGPNAERLREYWSIGGKGGAKLKWGLPGDFTRCNRHLRRYMGPRAAGYCQNLHFRNVGFYTGDKRNL